MGAEMSADRVRQLAEMGFSIADSRAALEATGGNVQAAAELLATDRARREREAGGVVAFRINELLRQQRPWPEFFERFLWPEHLSERVATNLLYYRANYTILCSGVAGVSLLMQPMLLVVGGIVGAMIVGAVEWGDQRPVPLIEQPLAIEQRLTAALLASASIVHLSGAASQLARVGLLCGGLTLGHAAFRARSLGARWAKFKDDATKLD